MPETPSMFPLEFFIQGTPMSQQAGSRSRRRWKDAIAEVVRKRIAETAEFTWLDQRPLSVLLFYFLSEPMEGDLDNIVKPILDAMVGIAYPNDRVVERVVAQKFEPDVDWSFEQPSEILLQALDARTPVVYVRLDDDLVWRQN